MRDQRLHVRCHAPRKYLHLQNEIYAQHRGAKPPIRKSGEEGVTSVPDGRFELRQYWVRPGLYKVHIPLITPTGRSKSSFSRNRMDRHRSLKLISLADRYWSGHRESNPARQLGRLLHNRYAMPAMF